MKSSPETASARVIKAGAKIDIHPFLSLQPNGRPAEMSGGAEEVSGEVVIPAIEEATFFPGEDPAGSNTGNASGQAAPDGTVRDPESGTSGVGMNRTAGNGGSAGAASDGGTGLRGQQAEDILSEARAEAWKIREEARKKGYEEGFRKGIEAGQKEAEQAYRDAAENLEQQTAKLLSEIDASRDDILKMHLGTLRDIAIAVGEKVIQISLSSSGEVIQRMIETEAEKHKKTAWVKIYIDKADYSMAVETSDETADVLSKLSDDIQFVVLDHKPRGYLIMETPEEIVDLSTATQIENIKNRLKEVAIEDEDIHVPADS